MADEFVWVIERARERVDPDPDERARLEAVSRRLLERAEAVVDDLPVEADVMRVGSTARDTWVSGERDIDVFVRFPPALDRAALERYGLAVGNRVVPAGRKEYAEHPYVTGEVEGFDVDLVPCYRVESATAIRSAVDRTPFHTRYVERHLDEWLAADVRVLKGFLRGIGVYGSDLRTRGFSGYLTELLVLEHSGLWDLLEAAADWSPPVRFDPKGHGRRAFDDPLVVIDPTDPERNVAAVCSASNLARLQHYARELLAEPRIEVFEPRTPEPLSSAAVRDVIDARGTTPVALRFPAPDLVDDQLYPQLEKSRAGIGHALDDHGFGVLRSAAFVDESHEHAVLLFELAVAERPRIERHEGPPVAVREHARSFYRTYADTDAYGPFIEGDRYVVERECGFTSAETFLASDALFGAALGTDVETALNAEYDLLIGEDVGELAAAFGTALADYFSPSP